MKLTTTLILVILLTANTFAQDASLSDFALAHYIKTNTNYPLSVNVINNDATTDVQSFSVSWQLDGGTVNTFGPIGVNGGLPSGGSYVPVSLSPDLNVTTEGAHTVKLWVTDAGDTNVANDTLTFTAIALSTYANKVVLLEEATAQWCENCPPAGTETDSLSALPWVAVQRFHNTDSLSFDDGQTYFDRYYNSPNEFFPAGEVEMTEFGTYVINPNYPYWSGDASSQSGISPVALTSVYSIDTATNVLTVTFTANFKYSEAGTYSFNGYLLESGIVEHQTMPDLSINNSYTHNNVVRALLGGITGSGGIIPATPVVNTDYTVTYTETIPAGWNINNLSLVGAVFNTVSGQTGAVNAYKSSGSLLATGISNVQAGNSLKVYPNPTTGAVFFKGIESGNRVEMFDMLGETIYSSIATSDNYSVNLNGKAKGMYFYRITGNTSAVQQGKVILE